MTETTKAPKRDLCRSVPFEVTNSEEDAAGFTMEGYAAVFDSPTRIDSWEGRFDETVRRGAFAKTISENVPVLQFDHGSHPVIGSIPIGSIKAIREDERGLFVKARLSDNWLVEPVRQAIAEGSISGMSFRFSVVRDKWGDGPDGVPTRDLTEVKVAELGPVVWPAYRDTEVGVRSRAVLDALKDADIRREVAQALLAHDDDDSDVDDEEDRIEEQDDSESTDAPVDDHPSRKSEQKTEAPLIGEHPSDDPALVARLAQRALDDARRTKNYLALIRKGAEKYDV